MEENKELTTQPKTDDTRTAYLIKFGKYIDSGHLTILGTSEQSIKKIIIDAAKKNELPGVKELIVVAVDLENLFVRYRYLDFSGEVDLDKLYLEKFALI